MKISRQVLLVRKVDFFLVHVYFIKLFIGVQRIEVNNLLIQIS